MAFPMVSASWSIRHQTCSFTEDQDLTFDCAIALHFILYYPQVLAGTVLTAMIGYFILPYGWSWAFCMTFGAILSATDPVAVSALLNELGAPPRLKIHISGESLLNDGSAIGAFIETMVGNMVDAVDMNSLTHFHCLQCSSRSFRKSLNSNLVILDLEPILTHQLDLDSS